MPEVFRVCPVQSVEARPLTEPVDEGVPIWQVEVDEDALAGLQFQSEGDAQIVADRLNRALEYDVHWGVGTTGLEDSTNARTSVNTGA